MRISPSSSSACLALAACFPIVHAITLSQLQPIEGFPQVCVNAYDTPLVGCTASDFEQGSCSTKCIAFLEAVTKLVNANCGGTSAYPGTLINSFFNNDGTSQLCPNVLIGPGNSNDDQSVGFVAATTFTLNANPTTPYTTPLSFTTITSSIVNSASTTSAPETTSTPSSASAAATTTQVAIINTTIAPDPPTSHLSTSSDHSHTKATTMSSSSRSTSTAGGRDNGGGTPLDVGTTSSSCHITAIQIRPICLLIGSVGLLLVM